MSIGVERLKKRADFLRVASVRRKWATPGMVVQAARGTATGETQVSRVGITVTKKVGNAVVRNRIKRRLRAAADRVIPERAARGWDFVLIGRQGSLDRDFADLVADLKQALDKVGATASTERGTS